MIIEWVVRGAAEGEGEKCGGLRVGAGCAARLPFQTSSELSWGWGPQVDLHPGSVGEGWRFGGGFLVQAPLGFRALSSCVI